MDRLQHIIRLTQKRFDVIRKQKGDYASNVALWPIPPFDFEQVLYRFLAEAAPYDSRRISTYDRIRRNIFGYDRERRDYGAISNSNA